MNGNRSAVLAVLAVGVVVSVVALGASSGVGPLATAEPGFLESVLAGRTNPIPSIPVASASADFGQLSNEPAPAWVGNAITTLVVGAALIVVTLFLWRLFRTVRRIRAERAAAARAAGEDLVEVPWTDVQATLSSSIVDLRSGLDVDDAIIECWRRLEKLGERSGLPRRPTDTSTDYVVRLIEATPADPAALDQLAGLYRSSMFSGKSSSDTARESAIAALEELSDALRPHPEPADG